MGVEWDMEERVLDLKVEVGRCGDFVGDMEDVVMEEEVVGVAEVDIVEEVGVVKEDAEGVDIEETEEEVERVSFKVDVKVNVYEVEDSSGEEGEKMEEVDALAEELVIKEDVVGVEIEEEAVE
jgi:hypothetical protein